MSGVFKVQHHAKHHSLPTVTEQPQILLVLDAKSYHIAAESHKPYCIVVESYRIAAEPPSQIEQLDVASSTLRRSGFNSHPWRVKNNKKGYFLSNHVLAKASNYKYYIFDQILRPNFISYASRHIYILEITFLILLG